MSDTESDLNDWLNLLDLSAIVEPSDKMSECQYFLDLASKESDVQRFRWLVSAFFSAAYSFFEISAMSAFHAFTDSEGELREDLDELEILGRYVTIVRNPKNPSFVKTGGNHEITKQLYKFRKGNTHHFPLSIMATDANLPESFHLGSTRGQGTPALQFCRAAMELMRQVNREVRA